MQNRQWFFYSLVVFTILIISSSCSSAKKEVKKKTPSVSKDEYNALLKRYESLQDEVRELKAYQRERVQTVLKQKPNNAPELPPADLVQTVDVFGGGAKSRKPKAIPSKKTSPPSLSPVAQDDINFIAELSDEDAKMLEADLFDLRKASVAIEKKKHKEGMDILKRLQKSPYRQIQVRAQFLISEALFKQGEFDLALQAYEDIIQRNAFSGIVIKTLGRLIVCADKLGIKAKKDQYHSMLHDFFEGDQK